MLKGILVICIVLNTVLFYSLIWGDRGTLAYTTLKQQCFELEEEINSLDKNNAQLQKEITLLKTDTQYMEKMIRKKLNFVKNDEILYIFPHQSTEQ